MRSENFNIGLNTLVAAAWELLSEVVRLKSSAAQENLHALNDRLASGIALFEARALHEGVDNTQVVGARYVLCSVIDEAVVTTAWGSQSDWSQISLLSRFHNETFGGEKFFLLLERMSRNSDRKRCDQRRKLSFSDLLCDRCPATAIVRTQVFGAQRRRTVESASGHECRRQFQ
ncbi:type IVB secretion system protein IcmH/DotU [Pseudomonas fluorescens]|nr:type IVB secretion system protein IcmH/DotU [Pseudomonas fluorescens]